MKTFTFLVLGGLVHTTLFATTWTVSTTTDSGAGSFRSALQQSVKGDSIVFANDLSGTIALDSPLPWITNDLTISGNGKVALDGQGQYQGLFVNGGKVAISDISINNGLSQGGQGGTSPSGKGGGGLGAGGGLFVNTTADVTLTKVSFNDNAANGGNGGSNVNIYHVGAGGGGGGGYGGDGGHGSFNFSNGSGGGGGGSYQSNGGLGFAAGGGGGGVTVAIGNQTYEGQGSDASFSAVGGDGGTGIGPNTGGAGGAPGSDGSDGSSQYSGGGGGGGAAPTNLDNGGSGGMGGYIGGGGGGGGGNVGGAGGLGGYSGGGGGGGGSLNSNAGGNGGDGGWGGGGGGGGGGGRNSLIGGNGGNGGPGGGGGGGGLNAPGGKGGLWAGNGGDNNGAGGGGAGVGGAIMMNDGAKLTLHQVSFNGNLVSGGTGGGNGLHDGTAGLSWGEDVYVHESSTLVLNVIEPTTISAAGQGNIIKKGAGTLTLEAEKGFCYGTVKVKDGVLDIQGTHECDITVNPQATLIGNATFNDLKNRGTVSPGNSIGTLNLAGNFTNQPKSNLNIQIEPSGRSDAILVDGKTVLNGTVNVFPDQGVYLKGTEYTFITSQEGVKGALPKLKIEDGSEVQLALIKQPHDVKLLVLKNVIGYPSLHLDDNAGVVKTYLENHDIRSNSDLVDVVTNIYDVAVNDTEEDFIDVLDQLQPAAFGTITWSNAFNLVMVNARQIARSIYWSERVNNYCRCPKNDLWVDVFVDHAQQERMGQLQGYHTDTSGVVAGFDYAFRPDLIAGISGGYTYTELHTKSPRRLHSDTDGYYLGLYSTYWRNCFVFDASVVGSIQKNHARRNINFAGIDRHAKGSFYGDSVLAHLGGAFNYGFCRWNFQPYVSAEYLFLNQHAHTEHGAHSIDLSVKKNNADFLRGEFGLNVGRTWWLSRGKIVPNLSLSYVRLNPISGSHFKAHFEGIDDTFSVATTNRGLSLFVPAVSVSYFMTNGFNVAVQYQGEFGQARQDNEFAFSLGWLF